MKQKKLLEKYQQNNIDYKFEENIRIGEIRKFAADVVPNSRFIFDNYKVEKSRGAVKDYGAVSFFSSHEKVLQKPETTFKNLRQFLTYLPIDYYILLQKGFMN